MKDISHGKNNKYNREVIQKASEFFIFDCENGYRNTKKQNKTKHMALIVFSPYTVKIGPTKFGLKKHENIHLRR